MKTKIISLVVIMVLFCLYSFSQTITFTATPDSGCAPLSVSFSNTSSGATSYYWDFSDGDFYTGTDTAHTFLMAGNYSVYMIGYDSLGNAIDTFVKNIQVFGSSGAFNMSVDTACPGEAINFSSNDLASNYHWDFGDGDTANGNFFIFKTYGSIGIYNVTLIQNTVCGADTIIQQIVVSNGITPPVPTLTISADSVCPTQTVNFFTLDNAAYYVWDFGDSTGDSIQFTQHSYTNFGNYIVTLTEYNLCGNSSSATDTVFVNSGAPPPPPAFTFFNDSVCPGENIFFIAPVSADLISFVWDFGDGTPSDSNQFTSHAFSNSGLHTVTLTVMNICGNTNSFSDTVTIINSAVPPPPAFFITGDSVCPGDDITFTAFLDAGIPFALWNFGDGNTDTSFPQLFGFHTIAHSFSSANSFTVSLTIQNQCGNTNSFSDTVTIINSAAVTKPNITAFPPAGCMGDVVTFNLLFSAPPSYLWDFGDGTLDSTSAQIVFGSHSISHLYNSAGVFDAILTVKNACGNSASDTAVIFIAPLPVAVITQSGSILSVTDTFSSYQWFLNDSAIIGETGQSYLATTNGNYYAVVTDANFCTDTSNTISIILGVNELQIEDYKLQIIPNPFINQTQITYSLNEFSQVKIELYNVLGQKIKTIVDEMQASGEYHKIIEVEKGNGIYFLKISVNGKTFMKSMVRI